MTNVLKKMKINITLRKSLCLNVPQLNTKEEVSLLKFHVTSFKHSANLLGFKRQRVAFRNN